MDPIYYQVNQTRLTEVTQKSSDNLRMQHSKESKNRAKKAGEIEEGALEQDSSLMSEDMLGDMDPDLFGGRGSAGFQQMWEEEMTREDPAERSEREGRGEGDEDPEEPHDDREDAEQEEERQAAERAALARQAAPRDDEEGQPVQRPADAPPAARGAPLAPPAVEPKTPPSPPAAPSEARKGEKLTITRSAGQKAASPDPVARTSGGGGLPSLGSLLDLSGGFLVGDSPPAPEELPDLEESVEEAPEAPLAPGLAELFEKLLVGESGSPAYRRLQKLLGRFGAGVLRSCVDHQVKVYLLPTGASLADHPLVQSAALGEAAEAAYLPSARACVFEERCLEPGPYGFHPVLFYFAHAFDHALGGEEFASLRSPAVSASFQACQDGPHRFADPLAAHSPAHYFAQAVESYLSESDTVDPIWTRQDLYDFDRSMYDYVEYLFKRKNG